MNAQIFFSVNSGLYLYGSDTGILIDAIHAGYKEGYSDMPEKLLSDLYNGKGIFRYADGLLFTHLHPDHYDSDKAGRYIDNHHAISVYGPHCLQSNIQPIRTSAWTGTLRIGNLEIVVMKSVHDGVSDRQTPHVSFLVKVGQERILIPGDADLMAEDGKIAKQLSSEQIDIMFGNYYQIFTERGQNALRIISPERLVIYHLPFPNDDRYEYNEQARLSLKRYPKDLPNVEFVPHMSWVDGKNPPWL